MKKYGRQRQHQHGYPDIHPPKGHVCWWEAEYHDGKSKKRERRQAMIDVEKEITEGAGISNEEW